MKWNDKPVAGENALVAANTHRAIIHSVVVGFNLSGRVDLAVQSVARGADAQ